MGQIIDDLLQLSKVSRGELNIQPTDLTAIARQVSSTLTLAHPGRSVEVLLEDDLVAHADSHQIQMVIENLLGNAWKYTALRQDARIEFGQLHINDQSVFFVRDNGVGFQMDYSEKLFEPFQRLHSAPEFEGSGIGLAIVQRIILRHGGRIWGEGEPGQGATFYFSLPD
jgi:light-regulated signal transduction histidine kinase (bacteriophytochrome)